MKKAEFDKLRDDESEFASKKIKKLLHKFVEDACNENNEAIITLAHDIEVLGSVYEMLGSSQSLTKDEEFDPDSITLLEAGSILIAILTEEYRDTLED